MIKPNNLENANWDSDPSGGFYIRGNSSYDESIVELQKWGNTHPQYWVWYSYDSEENDPYMLQVEFMEVCPPGATMMFWHLLQKGKDNQVAPLDAETAKKQMTAFACIGYMVTTNPKIEEKRAIVTKMRNMIIDTESSIDNIVDEFKQGCIDALEKCDALAAHLDAHQPLDTDKALEDWNAKYNVLLKATIAAMKSICQIDDLNLDSIGDMPNE